MLAISVFQGQSKRTRRKITNDGPGCQSNISPFVSTHSATWSLAVETTSETDTALKQLCSLLLRSLRLTIAPILRSEFVLRSSNGQFIDNRKLSQSRQLFLFDRKGLSLPSVES